MFQIALRFRIVEHCQPKSSLKYPGYQLMRNNSNKTIRVFLKSKRTSSPHKPIAILNYRNISHLDIDELLYCAKETNDAAARIFSPS